MSDNYADIVKPVAARSISPSIIYGFAQAIGGTVLDVEESTVNKSWSRSVVEIRDNEDGFIFECYTVLARCSACGRRFHDITFSDNDGSITECPHCNETLWW